VHTLTARRLAALFGFLAVALGAFGAHGLKATLEAHGGMDHWGKASLYHLAHAIVLLVLAQGALPPRGPIWCFATGITLFSGSLYLYALTKTAWLVALTPVGGLFLLAGWLWLALRKTV
jgi:uncharacterized membrane protein YgdD (TMEM256/DUF423 family)